MARIAYIDHSFHSKTLSTLFLVDILRRHDHDVDLFWDDSWKGGEGIPFDSVIDYDVIIMFQTWCQPISQYYRRRHDNVIAIPMLDSLGLYKGPVYNCLHVWESFHGCKVLSFSSAVHSIVTSLGMSSLYVRYTPPPAAAPLTRSIDGLRGFFWIRRDDLVSWSMVKELIGPTLFDGLHLHISPDPYSPQPTLPTQEDRQRYNITTSSWFDNKEDFFNILHNANVFFAPRAEEGIGQSFLESMARGQCVIALDNGTMNEYIIHGVNGLLYRKNNLAPLDFTRVPEMGINAWQTMVQGNNTWLSQEKELVDYILRPAPDVYGEGTYRHARLSRGEWPQEDISTLPQPAPSLYDLIRERLMQIKLVRKTRFLWNIPFRLIKRFIFSK